LNIAFVYESKRRRVSLAHFAFHPHPRLARVTRPVRPSLAATIDRFD
jgi:hypothetical protein